MKQDVHFKLWIIAQDGVHMNHISEYEYATERLSFKLTPSEMKKFQEGDGKNNKEKFKNLLNQI